MLREYGVEENIIESLSYYMKRDLVADLSIAGAFYDSAVIVKYNEDNGTSFVSNPYMKGAIGESYMDLLIVSINYMSMGELDEVKVKVQYDWKKTPFWKLTDAVGLTWDSDLFQPKPDSFESRDCSQTYIWTLGYMLVCYDVETVPSDINSNGVWWHAELRSGDKYHEGYGEIILEPKTGTNTEIGDTQFFAKYAHNKTPAVGVSMSIGILSISTSGAGYDTMAEWKDHDWDYSGC